MKRLSIVIAAAACIMHLSCKKQLNTVPTDFLTPVNYYKTEAQLNAALNGVYDPLGQDAMYANALLTYLSYGNDEGVWRASGQLTGPMVYRYDYTETNVNALWTAIYTGVNRVNVLLENIDKAEVTQAVKDKIKGQALFLRGYYYFLLADNWGGVPLKLSSTQSADDVDLAKTPVEGVYAQILKDMEMAETLLPTATDWGPNSCGRISKNTAQGMLARVNLTMAGAPLNNKERYNEVVKWCNEVFKLNQNALNPDFAQIFINHAQNLYDIKECMWEIEFYGNRTDAYSEVGYNGNRNGVAYTGDANFPGYSYGFLYVTSKLYRKYAAGDLRRDRTIANYTWTTAGVKTMLTDAQTYDRYPGKWRRDEELVLPRNKNSNGTNFPVLRYSDVLLMYAEAENELHGPANAYNAINQVRRRGFGKLLPGATNPQQADLPAGLSQTAFADSVKDERMRELAFECIRTHDLKRYGTLVSTLKEFAADIRANAPANRKYTSLVGDNVEERHVLYPIPSREMSLNRLVVQNKGW